MKKIVIGADKSGFTLKEALRLHLISLGYEVEDVGMQSLEDFQPYFEVAPKLAKRIETGEYEKGILCCGTGMGMNIVANKFKGVYAGVVEGIYSAKMCSVINNVNVLTMGGWIVTPQMAIDMVNIWLNTKLAQGFEDKAEFFCNALNEIKKIEEGNFS